MTDTATHRKCKNCGEVKEISNYYRTRGPYFQTSCKSCYINKCKEARRIKSLELMTTRPCRLCGVEFSARQRDKKYCTPKCQQKAMRLVSYGDRAIVLWREVLEGKRGCAACHKSTGLVIDHNHSTGAIRDVLCGACNQAIGMVSENTDTLRNLAQYLENHNG